MNKIATVILALVLGSFTDAKEFASVTAPPCIGAPVNNEAAAKCIALFHGQFISQLGALGKVWDVSATRKGDVWYVFPKEPNDVVPDGTILFMIDARTGTLIGGYKPRM